ncbi:conserved hypothetical protein [Vibrio nigripulchritudo MADA3029]|uniref:Asparaginyl-tRNA synthetase n=1 Tax=Vibrio nigripulchritudo SOn1 TaxID=1238450 RepID=A0AAV2VZV7_9VIBR|nr:MULTISPECIES: asparaginyl- tRNA synthetase [Vibrio]EGU60511.1 hypothetical protein VINI7043_04600 [Vibrio nigripulchritudo ATCC 27043]KJY75908.1 asparaginyl-tRNA synthetase [Vibrio nigripulchritudo]UAB71704.1 hypothetical protein INR79_07355 [Vibrio sp. SCSIO 43132]CCN36208.1 conserved hypothetical protein [Vibrio nigripulchritudo AM115]CCN43540.1 conserved hypothetical protein [Vibrio nigripulchritudo FTn2]
MSKHTASQEIKLIVVAIVCALMLVFGHLILAKSFLGFAWVETAAAVIPLFMVVICYLAVRAASKAEDSANETS